MASYTHDNKHLSLNQRKIIQTGIENRCCKVDIAKTIGKDATTVAKEIKKHRQFKPRNTFNNTNICVWFASCPSKCKNGKCSNYLEPKCSKRDRSPGACNKCPNIPRCRLDKYFYYATIAQKQYEKDLVDFREGFNLTVGERKQLAAILKPLLDQGQSLYQIFSAHPEIKQSMKTIYNYIDAGLFKEDGIDYFSLKEKVQRKERYKKNQLKKRRDPVNYYDHKYEDFLKFIDENPSIPITQMDSVYNDKSGPYIQTIMMENTSIMIGFIHPNNNSDETSHNLDVLEERLGYILFRMIFPLFITDRGPEFEKINLFESNTKTGETRLSIFYCDPNQPQQKPKVENNHNYVRDIIPNGLDISKLTQEDIDLMFSHINSTPRKKYNGRTPIEMLKFLYENEYDSIMKAFNLTEVKRDEVILKPYLLKNLCKNK